MVSIRICGSGWCLRVGSLWLRPEQCCAVIFIFLWSTRTRCDLKPCVNISLTLVQLFWLVNSWLAEIVRLKPLIIVVWEHSAKHSVWIWAQRWWILMLNVKQISLILHVRGLVYHILTAVLNMWSTDYRWFLIQQYLGSKSVCTPGATANWQLFFSLAVVVIDVVTDGFHD